MTYLNYQLKRWADVRRCADVALEGEDKLRYFVTCEPAASDALPVFLTQNEFMRRMKEMAAHQQGMSFYGQMPDQYNLVINTAHPLIQELVSKMTSEEVQEEVEKKAEKEGDAPTKETVIKTEPWPMQDAAEEAFRNGDADAREMKAAFKERR